jgi:serine/threonine-protein kinase RsbT
MAVLRHETAAIQSEQDVVRVRQLVRQAALELQFNLLEQTKVVTAASELGRNTLIHGGGGSLLMEVLNDGLRRGLRLTFSDQGPGIVDIDLALKEGYTTGSGLGLGLSGARKLMSEFTIDSQAGGGTRVTVTRWK